MLKLMFITSNPELARFASDCGVDRIFVDLETLGKKERQGHLDTVMSAHSVGDIARVRASIPGRELLVRVNPLNKATPIEVEEALAAGADLLMLPMFRSAEDVARFSAFVAGRVPIIPLVETPEAAGEIQKIVAIAGVGEVYIGLNDMHLALGQAFMFEPLANGMIDRIAAIAHGAGVPFGFGGIARVGEGRLHGDLILGEHLRLGSSSVILSRTFHRRSQGLSELKDNMDFGHEIEKLRAHELRLSERTSAQVEADRREVVRLVEQIAEDLRGRQR